MSNEDAYVEAILKASPSVINISSKKNNGTRLYNGASKNEVIGSGIIISNDGYIVTNLHVIEGTKIVEVEMDNGQIYPASLIGFDRRSDLAVIKINPMDALKPIEVSNSASVRVGDQVIAIGNAFGLGKTFTSGIISATGRDYGNPYLELIQTDAAINPGNSGGALVNEEGYLVGINTKIYSQSGSYEGLGFAIPSEKVFQAASELIKYGKVRNAWIGNFRVRPIRLSSNNQSLALEIIEIGDTGPLIEAGVVKGDLITSINNGAGSWNNLTQALKLAFPGDNIDLEVLNTDNSNKLLLSIKTQPIN